MNDLNISTAYDAVSILFKSGVKFSPLNLLYLGALKIKDKATNLIPLTLNYSQKRLLHVVKVLLKRGIPIRIHILKARQVGITTVIQAICYAFTSQWENIQAVTIADDSKGSEYIFDKEKVMHDELKKDLPWAVEPVAKNNEQKLEFAGLRSFMQVDTARNKNAGRKFTYQLVHLSESARFIDYDTLTGGLQQSVPKEPGTMVFDESTANGMSGGFYNSVMECYPPKGNWDEELQAYVSASGWVLLFIAWYEHLAYKAVLVNGEMEALDGIHFTSTKEQQDFVEDERQLRVTITAHHRKNGMDNQPLDQLVAEQLNWRRKTIKADCKGDVKLFDQEYPESVEKAFMASGRPALNAAIITKNLRLSKYTPAKSIGYLEWVNAYKDLSGVQRTGPYVVNDVCRNPEALAVKWVEDPHGRWKVWRHPEPGWENRYCMGADVAQGLLQGDYDDASVGDRVRADKKPGVETVAALREHLDSDVYADELIKAALYYHRAWLNIERNPGGEGTTVIKRIFPIYNRLYYQDDFSKGYPTATDIIGWLTTEPSKKIMVADLDEYTRNGWLIDPEQEFWAQCRTFVLDAKGHAGAQGKRLDPGVKVFDDAVMNRALMIQCHRWLPAPALLKPPLTGWRKKIAEKPKGKGVMAV